jgi:hypothetical protein
LRPPRYEPCDENSKIPKASGLCFAGAETAMMGAALDSKAFRKRRRGAGILMSPNIFISAGEASGEHYGALLIEALT